VQYVDAQLVNIENLRKNEKQGLQASVSANYSLTKNTKTINSFKADWGIQYLHKQHTFLFLGGFSLLKIDTSQQLINGGFEHLRYNYKINPEGHLSLEAFIQHQTNAIKYLERRIINGYGPRCQVIDGENFDLFLAPMIMYEYEIYNDDYNTITNQMKGDFILTFAWGISDILRMNHVTYFQPKLSNWNDFRLSSQTGFYVTLIKQLKFGVSFDIAYDSKPPVKDGVPLTKLFYTSQNFLTYTF
jgi:hypothetical protein